MYTQSVFESYVGKKLVLSAQDKTYTILTKYFNVNYCPNCNYDIVQRHYDTKREKCFDMCPRCFILVEKIINPFTYSFCGGDNDS